MKNKSQNILYVITLISLGISIGCLATTAVANSNNIQSQGKLIYENGSEKIIIDTSDHETLNSKIENNKSKIDEIIANGFTGSTIESNYSFEEKVVGTWVDGKPIYQKTIDLGVITGGQQYIQHGIENGDKCISIDGFMYNNDSNGSFYSDTNYSYIDDDVIIEVYFNYKDINAVYIASRGGFCNYGVHAWITVQYTKTTDEPNSFTLDMLETY